MHDVEVTKRCLQSVMSNSPMSDVELLLTDNGSTDGVGELLKAQEGPNVRVIRNEKNLGFSRPHTTAFERSSGDYFVMLNNDTVVPKGWLDQLRFPFTVHPKAALSAPRGGCFTLDENLQGFGGNRIDYLEAACLMAKSDIIRKNGLFSPYLFFAYGEDSDLSLRLRQRGYSIHHVDLKIEHLRGHTAKIVPLIPVIKEVNHQALRPRWMHYLAAGKMDYPIIVRREGAIGDVILTTPIVKALKETYPLSPIFVETKVPEVYRNNPWIVGAGPNPTVNQARIINLNMAYENLTMTHYLTAYQRAAWLEDDVEKRCYLFPGPKEQTVANARIPDSGWIAVHVGPSSWKGRNWRKERFEECCKALMDRGYKVVLIGSSDQEISTCTMNLCGSTTILELAAILARCAATVTIDSAPLHVAQAMGCPVVGLFGVSLPEFVVTQGSRSISVVADASKCDSVGIRHKIPGKTYFEVPDSLMDSIQVEEVLDAVERILEPVSV